MLRIALGSLVVLDVLLRLRDLTAFYTDQGVLPRLVLVGQSWLNPSYDLFLTAGTPAGVLVLFLLVAGAGACLAAGYHSRLSGLACWYLVSCVQLRNPMVLDGGDDLLRLMLFWMPFLPVGARWSLDARQHPEWKSLPNAFFSLATVGYVLQVVVLYLFAGLLKSDPVWRVSGDALYYALSIDQFATSLGRALVAYPDLLRPLTFAALAVELLLPVLLLLPWRTGWFRSVALALAWGLHLSIAVLLHLGLFMPIACLCLLGLLPSGWLGPDPPSPSVERAPGGYRLGWLTRTFVALVCIFVVGVNVRSLDPHPHRMNRVLLWFGLLTHENQAWSLFAPRPLVDDGWFWIEGVGEDGRPLTLLGGPDKPASVAGQFPNQRWRRWLQTIRGSYPDLRVSYLDYLARQYHLRQVRLTYVEELTPPPGGQATLRPMLLLERSYAPPPVRGPLRMQL